MSLENRQVAWTNEKACELAKNAASQHGAEGTEPKGKAALDDREMVCAAIGYAATFQ